MPAGFSIQPQDLLVWMLVGLVGGLVGGMVARGGSVHWSDLLLGIPGAIAGGLIVEFAGLSERGEAVGAIAAAFFGALLLTVILRLIPGRMAA
jgi:uncharacterized membrane protein YeaQ/YmgE (transglycosylase-associated protein family)